jgi:hypothetical protein
MRALKTSIYNPHPSPLPEGEGIFRDTHKDVHKRSYVGRETIKMVRRKSQYLK